MNSGLTHASATAVSQNARKISMELVPMSACSLRAPNDFGSVGCASAAVSVCDGVNASMRFVYHTSPPPLAGEAGEGAPLSLHGLSSWRDGPPPASLRSRPPPQAG